MKEIEFLGENKVGDSDSDSDSIDIIPSDISDSSGDFDDSGDSEEDWDELFEDNKDDDEIPVAEMGEHQTRKTKRVVLSRLDRRDFAPRDLYVI
ncbi:unnamed protein product [Ambrosiozyma monospora]|uniref:Unnamed protein product n=1 Tax=Ambrosiozyma monospora TaxID=43982 RepID=A0ACB5UA84_AMBMO|nr:unnamed protein product [Ambrosiozyma monospora]